MDSKQVWQSSALLPDAVPVSTGTHKKTSDYRTHSQLVRDFLKLLNSRKECVAVPITPGPYGRRGKADILFCYRGRFGSIEAKAGSDTLKRHQRNFARDVHQAGGDARVCRGKSEVKKMLSDMDRLC